MKKLSINVSTFRELISDDYLYIDKTRIIYEHIIQGKHFFLSRPRRFGKTLLISTLEEIYTGNRKLFKGLWIDSSDYKWPKHPVISLSFSTLDSKNPDALELSLGVVLDLIAKKCSIDISQYPTPGLKLRVLVETLAEENRVVVLIDEYDAPIVRNLTNGTVAEGNRKVLSDFFNVLKSLDAHLRAIFITGVSKFSQTSIFSGLNNLDDISLDPIAADLLGYTKEEITHYLTPYIDELAKQEQVSPEEIIEKMRIWYDGYQFSELPVKIYNPYSVLYLLKKKKFKNYWFGSSTPSFLVEFLKEQPLILEKIKETSFSFDMLAAFHIKTIPLNILLFQTGYLTIKKYDDYYGNYKLGYPNEEVKRSLSILQMAALTRVETSEVITDLQHMQHALEVKDINNFVTLVKSSLAQIPYQLHIESEAYYHSLFKFLCNLLGFENHCELVTSKGRIDLTISTLKYIYILEFKFNGSADSALNQIIEKRYYERYLSSEKELILVGVAFTYKDKELDMQWKETDVPG